MHLKRDHIRTLKDLAAYVRVSWSMANVEIIQHVLGEKTNM